MKHSDFTIGEDFFNAVGKWRCTDVGTRTITAVRWPDEEELPLTCDVEAWLSGPPYMLKEVVFDEADMALAYRSLTEAVERARQSAHPGFLHEDVQKLFQGQRRRMDERAAGRVSAITPLMEQLMRYERVVNGRALKPYDWKDDGQTVCVFDVFARTWGELPLGQFLRAPVATDRHYELQANQTN